MRISKLTFCNFRCFGAISTTLDLDALTVLIGSNGTGKTAALSALVKMFGTRPSDRLIEFEDFSLAPGTNEAALTELRLWIEAMIEFPNPDAGEGENGIAECFRHMAVDGPNGSLFCRIRLEASWSRNGTSVGEVEQNLYWIVSGELDPPENSKRRVSAQDRANIAVIYVPASRDPASQLRQASGSLLQPLLRAIEWAAGTRATATQAASQVRNAVRGEAAVQTLETAISTQWNALQSNIGLQNVQLQPLDSEFDSLVKRIEAVFGHPILPGAQPQPLERLSDGLRSLFYFALVGARFDLEQKLVDGTTPILFNLDMAGLPVLTVFAIEEPENHLAPHYLSRILALLSRLATNSNAQVLLTSQSPSVLGRVEPENVRHLQMNATNGCASIRKILLPGADQGEVFKYVKEAVRAHPELYFAKLVVLGEGDSEELVLPRAARALGQSFDQTFVSVVPLGGRHVNHFWRLLNDLKIEHVTLLDFDRERVGGAWARIKYVIEQLVHYRTDLTLASFNLDGQRLVLLGNRPPQNNDQLLEWFQYLETHNVYFSSPLDLDFLLLEAFTTQYMAATTGTGPIIPTTPAARNKRLESACSAVMKPEGGNGQTYTPAQRELFIWYQYLFLGRGKPVTHMLALNAIDDATFAAGVPPVLRRLVERCLQLSGIALPARPAA
jgi:putative ATP-dependent endonuclease of the OLD family